jgi:hypothetical protein
VTAQLKMVQPAAAAAAAVRVVPAAMPLAALVHLSLGHLLLQCWLVHQRPQPGLLLCQQQDAERLQVPDNREPSDAQKAARPLLVAMQLAQKIA